MLLAQHTRTAVLAEASIEYLRGTFQLPPRRAGWEEAREARLIPPKVLIPSTPIQSDPHRAIRQELIWAQYSHIDFYGIFANDRNSCLWERSFEYFGFIFYFFSNEHEPIHVHVKKSGEECIFDLIIENGQLAKIERREKSGADPLNSKDEATAVEFIRIYWKEIVEKWVTFFVYKQEVANTKINKRIK